LVGAQANAALLVRAEIECAQRTPTKSLSACHPAAKVRAFVDFIREAVR
jgi:hypothetical protein